MKYTWHFKIYFFYDDGIAENLLLIEQGNPQNSEQQKAQEDAKRSVSEILLLHYYSTEGLFWFPKTWFEMRA